MNLNKLLKESFFFLRQYPDSVKNGPGFAFATLNCHELAGITQAIFPSTPLADSGSPNISSSKSTDLEEEN